MTNDSVVLRFSDVSYAYDRGHKKLLDEASFSVRAGSRITLMGQNGAGKSTIFKLITGEVKPNDGQIFRTPADATVGIARQTMPREALPLTVREYFATAFKEIQYNLDKLIANVFEVVNLDIPITKTVKELSGGEQARLLLAHALIQEPDILLLDEPTNNLDQQGIDHLTTFLIMYTKTCLVISHDADFLNAFSDGVLYLDIHTQKVEQYTGNYNDVVEEISQRIERENLLNARMQRQIKEKRAQAEVFAHKGGKLRFVAKRMREAAETAEENIVSVRKEDKTIRPFTIPVQDFDIHFHGKIVEMSGVSSMQNHKIVEKKIDLTIRKNMHVVIAGPNGIGKSTLLAQLVSGTAPHAKVSPEVVVGYYQQDFGNMDMDQIAFDALKSAMAKQDDHRLRSTAAGFLLDGGILSQPIRALSEGQKGLLSYCRLVLQQPGLLVLDEPTNHINFRHLPVLAKALDEYQGALIMVSHIPDFVAQIRVDTVIDLEKV
ncbi:MAG: ABC-F family ATP-binding cassette domain-containing protein [Candidatus Kerfeldbacteria bacterium]|nr:ABC-F family ATP-binding cassette domain-containing protein [Candidatus Kerfeldbacteria bacterium]